VGAELAREAFGAIKGLFAGKLRSHSSNSSFDFGGLLQ